MTDKKNTPYTQPKGHQFFVIDAIIVDISKPHFTFSGQRQHWNLSLLSINLFILFEVTTRNLNWSVRILLPNTIIIRSRLENLMASIMSIGFWKMIKLDYKYLSANTWWMYYVLINQPLFIYYFSTGLLCKPICNPSNNQLTSRLPKCVYTSDVWQFLLLENYRI